MEELERKIEWLKLLLEKGIEIKYGVSRKDINVDE
jgi:hypothetical protein